MEVNGVTYPGLNPSLNVFAGRDNGVSATSKQHQDTNVLARGTGDAGVRENKAPAPAVPSPESVQRKQTQALEKMVLQPREVSFEERMAQVISLEDIQRILLVRSPFSMREAGPSGQQLDFKT